MSIIFGVLTPHPPIIIPAIGGNQIKKVEKTIQAMKKLADDLEKAEPDTIIVISPHGLIYPDQMNICAMPKLAGDFSDFGHPEIKFKYQNDLALAQQIAEKAEKEGIDTLLYDNGSSDQIYQLDHGTCVPLYYLAANLTNIKILPVAYSYQDRLQHFAFGQVIAEVANRPKNRGQRIAVIASGDLSHRLILSAPAGFSAEGKKFDRELLKAIKKSETETILSFDEELVEEAGECGYHSILILLGALNHLKTKPEILSYEGPFGVGYGVINFKIGN